MKKLFSLALLVSISFMLFAQEDDTWINRTKYYQTENCIDSISCYTKIVVDINKMAVIDSFKIHLIVGSEIGASDKYNQEYIYTSDIYEQVNVADSTAFSLYYTRRVY
jgi:hypothetical protein